MQFSGDHLAFDFQSHHKEEDGHQDVVDDQVTEVPIDFEFSKLESHMGMPKFLECLIPRGVGDDKRDQGREHQDDAAGSLDVQEAFYRDEPDCDSWHGDLVGAFADRLVCHRIRIDVGLAVVSIRRQQAAEPQGFETLHPIGFQRICKFMLKGIAGEITRRDLPARYHRVRMEIARRLRQ